MSFLALLFPTFILLHFAFAGWWLFRGSKRSLLSIAMIALSYGHIAELVGLSAAADANNGDSIHVGVYNLLGGSGIYNKDPQKFQSNLKQLTACLPLDVLATVETPRYKPVRDGMSAQLDSIGLRYHFIPDNCFVALHSSYPLSNARVIEAFNDTHGLITAQITHPRSGDTLTLLAAHLESNHVRLDASRVIKDAVKARKRAYWTLRDVAANYRRGARKRVEQAELIARTVEASKYPVILLADLNDTPLSYTVGTVRRSGLQDAFRQNGRGLGITYPGTIPGLRIDYVLADSTLQVLEADVRDCGFSDHNATTARIQVSAVSPTD